MKKCLIVVDYQNDFVSGSLGCSAASTLEKPIADKIASYRKAGDDILFTFDTHGSDYLQTQEGKNLPVPHCIKNTEGHDLYGSIAALKEDGDKCFYKSTFGSTELFSHLQGTEYETIELAGVVTNICVIANAVIAKTARPETPVLVDALCTASNDPALHTAALKVMASMQVKIINGTE